MVHRSPCLLWLVLVGVGASLPPCRSSIFQWLPCVEPKAEGIFDELDCGDDASEDLQAATSSLLQLSATHKILQSSPLILAIPDSPDQSPPVRALPASVGEGMRSHYAAILDVGATHFDSAVLGQEARLSAATIVSLVAIASAAALGAAFGIHYLLGRRSSSLGDAQGADCTADGEDVTAPVFVVTASVIFTEGFAATTIFPFCAQMTTDLLGVGSTIGLHSGLIYTVSYTGMLLMQYPWTRLSDFIGRRQCLLLSTFSCLVCSVLMAFTNDYWTMVVLRFVSGLLNGNSPLARTSLREAFNSTGADDTWAFSHVSVAYAVSSLLGPSVGGFLYGGGKIAWDGQLSWTLPWLLVAVQYFLCFLAIFFFQPETAFLRRESEDSQTTTSLFRDPRFMLVLLMAWGHSYVFIGWETTYATLAEFPAENRGEEWSPAQVGTTFLVGGIALIAFNTTMYPRIVQKLSVVRVWTLSWVLPVVVLLVFPRFLTYLIGHGVPGNSAGVVLLNYAAQVVVSMLLGSGFTSVQLILNRYVATLPDGAAQLASANGALASSQALARAVSPAITGALFSAGFRASFLSRATTFDVLAVLGLITGVLCARLFEMRAEQASCVQAS